MELNFYRNGSGRTSSAQLSQDACFFPLNDVDDQVDGGM